MTLIVDQLSKNEDIHVKNTATRILTFLISKDGFLGLTVPELLDTFVRQLRQCVEQHDISLHLHLRKALIEAIGKKNVIKVYNCGRITCMSFGVP